MIIELFMTFGGEELGQSKSQILLHLSREDADTCYIEHKIFSSSLYSVCCFRAGRHSGHPHRRISFESGGREAWNKYWTGQPSQGSMTEEKTFLIGYQTWSILYLLTAFSVHFLFT